MVNGKHCNERREYYLSFLVVFEDVLSVEMRERRKQFQILISPIISLLSPQSAPQIASREFNFSLLSDEESCGFFDHQSRCIPLNNLRESIIFSPPISILQ